MSRPVPMPRILVLGALPPPINGMTRLTETILASPLTREFELVHLDTSDHRDIRNIGRIDVTNMVLAVWHLISLVAVLALRRPALVHVPIARNRLGVLRDALFLLAIRAARRPAVVNFNARGFQEFFRAEPRWFRALVRFAAGPQTAVTVLAESRRHEFEDVVELDCVHVVPNGIADPGVGEDAAARPPVVLHLTTLWTEKGTFELINAMRPVLERCGEARFVLAGPWYSGEERGRALAMLAEHDLNGSVELPGAVHDEAKWQLLRRAAVLALPSWTEGQPYVILEALACGTPVVATRVGAIPDSIDDGVEGFLVGPRDATALADRLGEVITDSGLRSQMGQAARRRFERDFSTETFARNLGAVWRAALTPKAVTSRSGPAARTTGRES